MELFQKTGSFKPRGAFNQILASGKDALAKGAVAFSGGNFAQGVAYASLVLGVDTIICMPENTPQNYVDATRGYSATIDFSTDMHTAFSRYNDLAEQGRKALHPFDNHHQMSGAGTVALEIFEDLPEKALDIRVKLIKPDLIITRSKSKCDFFIKSLKY